MCKALFKLTDGDADRQLHRRNEIISICNDKRVLDQFSSPNYKTLMRSRYTREVGTRAVGVNVA